MLTRSIATGVLAAAYIAEAGPAHAYIDPGMGSMLLQGIVGGAATFLVVIRLYGARAKREVLGMLGWAADKAQEPANAGE